MSRWRGDRMSWGKKRCQTKPPWNWCKTRIASMSLGHGVCSYIHNKLVVFNLLPIDTCSCGFHRKTTLRCTALTSPFQFLVDLNTLSRANNLMFCEMGGYGRRLSVPLLMYHPRIFLKGLRNIRENFSQDNRLPSRQPIYHLLQWTWLIKSFYLVLVTPTPIFLSLFSFTVLFRG